MIKTESTQNPNVLKFVFEKTMFAETKEYTAVPQTTDFPLAGQLLQFPFVKSVLTSGNFIALLKIDDVNWEDVQDNLLELMEENISQISKPKINPLIEVFIEATPNPDVIKLITNKGLYGGIAEAQSKEETENFPMAQWLFNFDYIDNVFVNENYIALTKKPNTEWQDHTLEIRDEVAQYLRQGKPVVSENYVSPSQKEFQQVEREYSDLEKEIQHILEEYIKPAVAGDGGNIDLVNFDEDTKTAKMLLQGACSGCPSSTITLKNGIETILKQMLPGKVENVEAVNA